eukprot:4346744-Pyramimonas_sp.AAC.2
MLYGVDFVHDVVMDRGGRIQLSHNLCSLRGNVDLTSTPQDVPEDDDFGTSCRSVPASGALNSDSAQKLTMLCTVRRVTIQPGG